MMSNRRMRGGLLFCCMLFIGTRVSAQVEHSSLTGMITDPQGDRIPRAKIKVTEVSTGLQRETETTSQGSYRLFDLPTGTFSVQISKAGFSTVQVERVKQVVGQTRTLNVTLRVSEVRQQT